MYYLGLFHKTIMQSGVNINPWGSMILPPIKIAEKLGQLINQDIYNPKKFVEYLQTLDINRIIELEKQIPTLIERELYLNPFLPSIDKKAKKPFLSIPLEEAIKNGFKVPCIMGFTSHEGILVVAGY